MKDILNAPLHVSVGEHAQATPRRVAHKPEQRHLPRGQDVVEQILELLHDDVLVVHQKLVFGHAPAVVEVVVHEDGKAALHQRLEKLVVQVHVGAQPVRQHDQPVQVVLAVHLEVGHAVPALQPPSAILAAAVWDLARERPPQGRDVRGRDAAVLQPEHTPSGPALPLRVLEVRVLHGGEPEAARGRGGQRDEARREGDPAGCRHFIKKKKGKGILLLYSTVLYGKVYSTAGT